MDAGKYYALLRFEQASLALRAALDLRVVETIGDRELSMAELREEFGFTTQATRTFVPLLEVMEIVSRTGDRVRVADRAHHCLADHAVTSRRPYLAMGSNAEVETFIELLRGNLSQDSLPLYGGDDIARTVMDVPDLAREIAIGLASRARNFAEPLAAAIRPHAGKATILADIGAGSPHVASACLTALPQLSKAILVDRSNGLQFVREMAEEDSSHANKLEFREQDFFQAVPPADIYCLSNTAHDWLPAEYAGITLNVRDAIAPGGVVCVHEPLLVNQWNSAEQWVHALWMACYAVTLFRLTEGKGTCYTRGEHDQVMSQNGFVPIGDPVPTTDGCTALFYQLERDAKESASRADTQTQTQSQATR